MTPQAPARALSSWSTTRPEMENTNILVRGFTRLNVYLYSKPQTPLVKKINRSFLHLNIVLFQRSKGRIFGRFGGLEAMLITTTGRRTGKERTNPLGYLYDKGRFIVCAAPGHFDVPGGPQASNPAWYWNLTSDPRATVDLGPERFPAVARILAGAEREEAWARFTAVFPFMASFQERCSHLLPMVVLTPADAAPAVAR